MTIFWETGWKSWKNTNWKLQRDWTKSCVPQRLKSYPVSKESHWYECFLTELIRKLRVEAGRSEKTSDTCLCPLASLRSAGWYEGKLLKKKMNCSFSEKDDMHDAVGNKVPWLILCLPLYFCAKLNRLVLSSSNYIACWHLVPGLTWTTPFICTY